MPTPAPCLRDGGQRRLDELFAARAPVLVPSRVAPIARCATLPCDAADAAAGLRRASHRLGFHVTDSTAYCRYRPIHRPRRFRWQPRPARPRSSAGTGSRSPAPTPPTRRRPTRTCSPRPSTGWSPASACRASSWARSSPAPSSSTRATSTSPASRVLGSKLSATTPAYDVQQACGTGLEAAILVANKIALGQIESGIAGGVDTTSDAPLAVGDDLRRVLISLNNAKTRAGPAQGAREDPPGPARAGDPAQRRAAHRPGDGRPRRDHRQGVGDRPRGAGRARRPLAPEHGRRLRPRLLRRPGHAVPRA